MTEGIMLWFRLATFGFRFAYVRCAIILFLSVSVSSESMTSKPTFGEQHLGVVIGIRFLRVSSWQQRSIGGNKKGGSFHSIVTRMCELLYDLSRGI